MVLAGPILLLAVPLAFGYGLAGIRRDSNKLLAILVALISGSAILLFAVATKLGFQCW